MSRKEGSGGSAIVISRIFRVGKHVLATALFLGALVSEQAKAQDIIAEFRVSISGFPVGRVSFEGVVEPDTYKVQGFLGSSGFFGFFIATRYSGASIGSLKDGFPVPEIFRGRFEQRRQFAQVDMKYVGGKATEIVRTPPRPPLETDVPPEAAVGNLDPITALYYVLRDRAEGDLCRQDFRIYDGTRTARVALAPHTPSELTGTQDTSPDVIICDGNYRRIGGFTDTMMEDGVDFPFRVKYRPKGDTYEVFEFLATTSFGLATAVRR